MKNLFLIFALGLASTVVNAQTPAPASKIGYADVDRIFSQLPEAKQIDSELQSLQTQLKNNIDTKYKEFQTKLADYQQKGSTMLEPVRANYERELQQLQQNIEKLQQDAQTTIQDRQTKLMQPVYEKVGKAIEAVAKENGFTLILSAQLGGLDVVLYGDEKSDASDLVLKKLGVTPKPTTTPPAK